MYDGDGNRVKKTASSTTTLYWPGAGSLLDESNSSGTSMGKQVQFAGLLVWHEDTAGTGNFLFQDHLGSVRVTGDASGTVHDDSDFLPFGTQFANYGASPSDNHYLFTGYESDASESNTDYSIFRNLSYSMGRFNRPDPYDGSYDPSNPQSLNRYSYVLNNPMRYVDPSGLDCLYFNNAGDQVESVDTASNSGECWANGGDWVNGTFTSAQYNASNDTFNIQSTSVAYNYSTTASAPGSQSDGTGCYGNCNTANGYSASFNYTGQFYYLPTFSSGSSSSSGSFSSGAPSQSAAPIKPSGLLPYPSSSVLSPNHKHDECVNGAVLTSVGVVFTVGAGVVLAIAGPEVAAASAMEETAGETALTFLHSWHALGHLLVAPLFAVAAGTDMMAQNCGHN